MKNHQSGYNNIQTINSKRGGGKRFSLKKLLMGQGEKVKITELGLADLTM